MINCPDLLLKSQKPLVWRGLTQTTAMLWEIGHTIFSVHGSNNLDSIDLFGPSDCQDCGHNDLLLKLTGAAKMVDFFRTWGKMRHEIPNEGLYVSLLNMWNVCCNMLQWNIQACWRVYLWRAGIVYTLYKSFFKTWHDMQLKTRFFFFEP